ncbi:MAG: sulfatase [Chloroflexi bacterium]|nr:sulfatase [Chloroflexota bacterium]
MNLIIIVVDSWRQDHVGYYHRGRPAWEGVPPVATPNIDAFARECIVFDNAYPEALPTIPIRCQLMTGQRTLPFRPWQPLMPTDVTLAEILREEGYVCGLISDTYHYRAPGMNYHRGFHAYEWVRGQEYDPYQSAPPRRNVDAYVNAHYPEIWRRRVAQFLANTDDFRSEEDWFAPQVVRLAVEWLRKNRTHEKIFLWIDSFDPHEPWDPPPRFDTYGDPAYRGPRLILPMGGRADDWATAEEQRAIRGLYSGEVAAVDAALGPLFTALGEYGYLDDSIILFLSDHGHPLGDHGKFLKGADRLYNELLKVPFMVRLPGGRQGGRRTRALVEFDDVAPTLLDLLGLASNAHAMHGRSFRPVLEGDTDEHRPHIITGYHDGVDRCIRDQRWSLILRPEQEPDELYDLLEDPRERQNLIDRYPEEARRLASAYGRTFFRRGRPTVIKGIQGQYEMSSGSVA